MFISTLSKRWSVILSFLLIGAGLIAAVFWWKGSLSFLSPFGGSEKTAINTPEKLPEPPSSAELDPDVFHIPAATYPRGLNLIFFADGYLSWQEFDVDVDIILRRMKTVEPWRSYSRYNIYRIRPKDLDICLVKVADERKPVLRCNSDGINRYLNQLQSGHFKLIVLSRREFQSWANVVRLQDSGIFFSIPRSPETPLDETALGWLFLHLLGHAFGLKDEEVIVIAKAHSAPHRPDGPNCAPDRETAERWWGDLAGQDSRVGYFSGCASKKEYVKPTEGSLMNLGDLSKFVPDYGPVSERYLRKILDYCFSEAMTREADDPEFFTQYPEFRECASRL
jgi:hypothetical protein